MSATSRQAEKLACYHCGEPCPDDSLFIEEKQFCCTGCRMVYQILQQNELCDYYKLNERPGVNQRNRIRKDKFAFLDDEKIEAALVRFRDDERVHINFYMPQMHCSSCLYLLENLHRLDPGVLSCKVNFTRKEADIIFNRKETNLRHVAETLAEIGYEPYISLNDIGQRKPPANKSLILQLGVAGFCFANIMLLSFPEYLGIDASESGLRNTFRWINFGLSLPVLLFSALPFYISSWKSLRHKFLHIDIPIALAIIITFIRSVWEVVSGNGGGYFDSMTGIVFFMLAGRLLQDNTQRRLSFDRDYTSYFPVAVTVIKKTDEEMVTSLPDLKPGDTILIHNEELIPADGILTRGRANIDYSFVTGESVPVPKEMGELVYAGGRQIGSNIELLLVKEVAQSYLTSLWSKEATKPGSAKENTSFVHLLSRYFTFIVFAIAAVTALYWQFNDPARLWAAVTSVFIIACPCALLISNSFTNGSILQVLGRNKFYLRDAQTIERIADTTHIVFDKTGTLTSVDQQDISYDGILLTPYQMEQVAALAGCSSHPLSKALVKHLGGRKKSAITAFNESPGLGVEAFVGGDLVKVGSSQFITGKVNSRQATSIYVSIEERFKGRFIFRNHYRDSIAALLKQLQTAYGTSVLSGDNENEKENLRKMTGPDTALLFEQSPQDKLNYIRRLQQRGEKVMMIGDGLNDAGALKQSDIGIAVAENINNFTPASDAIMEAHQLPKLNRFLGLCRNNRRIVTLSFAVSILYNIIGLFFAVQAVLSPLIAALLMPASSFTILILTFGASRFSARMKHL